MTAKRLLISAATLLMLVSCRSNGPAPLEVMSFNIRLGVAQEQDSLNNWENRREAAVAMIADIAPAVFGVQEAYDFQLDYIVEKCPQYRCVGVGREDGLHGGEHMSVLYDTIRLELKDWGTYWLSETPEVPSFGWDAACKRTAIILLYLIGEEYNTDLIVVLNGAEGDGGSNLRHQVALHLLLGTEI